MIIIVLFICAPFLIGLVGQYIVCRVTRLKRWRICPLLAGAAVITLITLGRIRVWSSTTTSVIPQLIFFPGLSAVFLLLGLFAGWRLWNWRWLPKIIKKKR